jgi:hypothetical protein
MVITVKTMPRQARLNEARFYLSPTFWARAINLNKMQISMMDADKR